MPDEDTFEDADHMRDDQFEVMDAMQDKSDHNLVPHPEPAADTTQHTNRPSQHPASPRSTHIDSFDISHQIDIDDSTLVEEAINDDAPQQISPFYAQIEAKRAFYRAVLPKQRSLMIFLTYLLCLMHVITIIGMILFAHPLTILMGFAQLVSLLYNIACLVWYHFRATTPYLEKNLSYPAAQCMFNIFVGGLAIFANGMITTLVLVSLFESVTRVEYSCFFFCFFSIPGIPFWLWCTAAFLNNILIYLSAIFSFGQGYAAGMFLVHKESLELLPTVDKFGVPTLQERKIQRMRSRVVRLQRLAFGSNIGLMLVQILFAGFMAGVFLVLLVWNLNALLLVFYVITALGTFFSTISSSSCAIVLKYFYWRKLCLAANLLQGIAAVFSIGYALVLLLSVETLKLHSSTITFLILGGFAVVNVAKALVAVTNFILGVSLTVIRVRMSHVARIAYYSTPTWRRGQKSVEEIMFDGAKGMRHAPEYDDLMFDEYHSKMNAEGGRSRSEEPVHEDAIELTITRSEDDEDVAERVSAERYAATQDTANSTSLPVDDENFDSVDL